VFFELRKPTVADAAGEHLGGGVGHGQHDAARA
jgi:hypothetical protein